MLSSVKIKTSPRKSGTEELSEQYTVSWLYRCYLRPEASELNKTDEAILFYSI